MDRNHRAKFLPELKCGYRVWVKAGDESGFEGAVVRQDKHPESVWVTKGDGEVRRNRKHVFPFKMHTVDNDLQEAMPPLSLLEDTVSESLPQGGETPQLARSMVGNGVVVEPYANNQSALLPNASTTIDDDGAESGNHQGDVNVTLPVDNSAGDASHVEEPDTDYSTRSGRRVRPVRRDGYVYY